jgi:uncharacterized protein (DUF1778 family)
MKRTTQVNVRLTPEEKAMIASAAAAKADFKGFADWLSRQMVGTEGS